MKILYKINWILLILLSISTGVFKLLQQEADIMLFEVLGMNATHTTLLGLIQVIAGILLIPSKTRKLGALIIIPTFILATIALFMNQMIPFGLVSLIFILMGYWVYSVENKKVKTTN